VEDNYHRAIYLQERTLAAFTQAASLKCGVSPTSVREVIRMNSAGILIKVDDELLQEMKEGQDMNAVFEEMPRQDTMKHEEGLIDEHLDETTEPLNYLLKLEF